ncbi:iron complex transport system substrate-binding protein [Nakamurella sp. UYEF19]|uniref:ABC transporter substrate-binding protein n=1 Tax=Nakamurella sp. UYEF19 TaxID=1756392 RepID=UPI0033965768
MTAVPRIHTRRDLLRTGLLVAAGAGLAAACGTTSTASRAAPSSGSVATGFPITTAHKFGSTVTKTQPARVLSLGYTDHEVLLALGIVPIGVIQWIPEWKKGVSTWTEKLLEGTTPTLFQYELDFEKAASLKPDLIFNIGFDPDQKTYDTLTAIAPTVAPPKDTKPYGVAWEEMTTMVSIAVGRKADGEKLIADTKALLAKTAADNPSFKGKTVAIGNVYQGEIGYYTKTDIRNQLLRELGFVDNKFISGLTDDNFYGTLSPEKVDSLDADLLIFFGEKDTTQASLLKAYPSLATVPAIKEGRLLLMTDTEETMAFSAASVLSIPIALEALVPRARKVLG